MKWLALQPADRIRLILALVAGLCCAAAFPKISLAGLGWLAPGLMLASTFGASPGGIFRLGYVAGLVHYLASLYWLLFIPVSFAPVLGWVALSAYCALYPALWVWLCWKLYPGGAPRSEPGRQKGLIELAEHFLAARWSRRLHWALLCAALWVAAEMIRSRFLTGFPWNPLGASQYRILPVIQVASFTGVYGVSFLMVWTSVSLLGAALLTLRRPEQRNPWLVELFLPVIVVIATVSFGMRQLFSKPVAGPSAKLALIQPSIPQTMIWNPADSAERFQQLIALSEQALTNRPDVLIWPEAAVPNLLRWDTNIFQSVVELVRRHNVWLILGADDAERARNDAERVNYFNSSFLITPAGEIAASYRKRKLVIFGEYVPLQRWLPFLKYLTPIQGGFTPGPGPVSFVLGNPRVKTSVLICFEDIFPHVARDYAEPDTDFLLNLTNNGWFGESAAQWQHAAMAVFRAVENGLPLVRCANNGLTCWIDSQGRLHEIHFPGSDNIYQAGFKLADVPILGGRHRPLTLFAKQGDWFGWLCVALATIRVVWRLATRRVTRG